MDVSPRKELDYLLGLLQEEAGEVVCETSKALRFGLYERYSPEYPTNMERIQTEVKDLLTVATILEDLYGFDFGINKPDKEHENTKREKIAFYDDLSRHLGLLED